MKKTAFLIISFFLLVFELPAQHDHMQMKSDSNQHAMKDTMPDMMSDHGMMSSAFSRNLPMNRDGSGTAWLPDHSQMHGYMVHWKKWMFMFHGNVFIRYNHQDFTSKGSRGGDEFDAPNMLMAMGQRNTGKKGIFHFGMMFSLDALITGGNGYPLLFQTGETWNGKPLVDRQHPHDLFSELSVSYAYALSSNADVFVYLGYPGEPALGPVTFMHRASGMYNPDAPLSHHWVDATHITFGVATLGFRYRNFRIEGSSFTGREPDENRYNFDTPRFDSWSARFSYNPTTHFAFQASHAFIKSPEAAHPEENINRTTVSGTFSSSLSNAFLIDATILWGLNAIPGNPGSNAMLAESTIRHKGLSAYTQYEWVQKSGEELDLDEKEFGMHTLYTVNAITLGAGYDLFNAAKIHLAPGAQMSLYFADKRLNDLYGKYPLAGEVYVHVYW